MLVVHGTFRVKPEAIDRLRAALGPVLAATREEEGNVFYDWAQSVEDPGTFYSVEIWRSRQDSDAHMASEHVATGFADVPDMLAAPPEVVGFDGGERSNLLG